MREMIRHNIKAPCSLHDMNVIAFEVEGDDLIMRTQSGMFKTTRPYRQFVGHVEFHDVQWDFSYAYLMEHTGNTGVFSGEKMFLRNFVEKFRPIDFTVMDETYGYNTTKYTGYLAENCHHYECMVEIYHEGNMVFVDETEYSGMREVILSHDSEAMLCLVPTEVADNLEDYCLEFAFSWVWNGPENGRYMKGVSEDQFGAMFGAAEFIDYLNRWVFPDCESKIVKGLGCYDYEIPEEYQDYPQYNF